MHYLVIERFTHGPAPIYQRLAERGRMMPEGLAYVSSWITDDLTTCYQVMETDDRALQGLDRQLGRPGGVRHQTRAYVRRSTRQVPVSREP